MKKTIKEIKGILEDSKVLISAKINDRDEIIENLLTDSRSLGNPEGTLFIAVRTRKGNDGNRFIAELYEKGVRNFLSDISPNELNAMFDSQNIPDDINLFLVEDARNALLVLGRSSHPDSTLFTAIIGSRGKTILKEWLFQLLEPLFEISRSPRSYNSQIGVPLSMWEVEDASRLALIEAGISRPGEMKRLAECIDPHTVIFLNVTDAHSEGFASLEEKAAEKALMAAGENVRRIIYNLDDENVVKALSPYFSGRESIGFSFENPDADLLLSVIPEDKRINYVWRGMKNSICTSISGKENYENMAAALAFMLSEGISHEKIEERFHHLHPISTRLNVTEGMNGCSIIFDSYTSDFSSLKPAVDFMLRRKMPLQKTVLVMSDLLHETAKGQEAYARIAEIVKENKINKFIGIGSKMVSYRNLFPVNSDFYATTEQLLENLSASDFIDEIILLKGAQEFRFEKINEMLDAKKHETVLEVNLESIVANYNYFRGKVPRETGIIAMVKASGYGAGSYEIAKTLQDCGAAYLAVAVLDEGMDLRRNGISMPIMIMNPKAANYKSMFTNSLEPEIYSLEMLDEVIREAKRNHITDYPIHIKLDTGMHRMGFITEQLPDLAEVLRKQNAVKVETVFSHLATADCLDMDEYTLRQLKRFDRDTEELSRLIGYTFKRHILNTAGILRFPAYHYDFVRLGIGLYGANTLPPEIEKPLATVSTLRTIIISIKEWKKGEAIGYGRKGMLTRDSKIATLPIGYADGMNRHFGNGRISVKVNGKDAPTIGNICMDACMIDVTGIDCRVGDSVEIFGNEAPLQRLADTLETIPYEILTSVSPRVKRIYFRD